MSDVAAIADVIARIAVVNGRAVDVSVLSGGAMNGVFLVSVGGERFVVRVPGEASALLGLDRAAEHRNAAAAAESGVSPRILEYLDDANVMVLEFIEGRVPTSEELQSPGQVRRIATALRRLHRGPRFGNDVDMFATAKRWLQVCDQLGFPVPDGVHVRMQTLENIARGLAAPLVISVPCHNDVAPANFIDDGRRLWLIDFEFSGNNDPCNDLGTIASEAEFDDDLRALLCEAYFGAAALPFLARMKLHVVLGDLAKSLFCAIQAEVLADPRYWEGVTAYWAAVVNALDSEQLPRLIHDASQV